MNQITKTVEQFLSFIVGVGLVCAASFIFLLASAQLNGSRLGTLLAGVAGETAKTARTESFAYWGKVGSEVATGLGYGEALGSGTGSTTAIILPTQIVVVATSVPAATQVGSTAQATPLPAPTAYVKSTGLSEGGLLLWRGLDAEGKLSPYGVSLKNVQQQVNAALSSNSGDLLALWLQGQVNKCIPLYNKMVTANYQDPAQTTTISDAAGQLLAECNPRLVEAYARRRYAEISSWLAANPFDPTQAKKFLAGLQIKIGNKTSGPARGVQPQDTVEVTLSSIPEFGLGSVTFNLTVGTLDDMLGAGQWQNGSTYIIDGEFFPASLAEPRVPSDADLQAPTVAADVQGGGSGTPGKYVVQQGDWVSKIAKDHNVTVQELIAANPNTLGVNPDYITPGMELNIP